MNLIAAVTLERDITRIKPLANVELRRACWEPSAFLSVGSTAIGFYRSRDESRVGDWAPCPEDILADDWEVNVVDPEGDE